MKRDNKLGCRIPKENGRFLQPRSDNYRDNMNDKKCRALLFSWKKISDVKRGNVFTQPIRHEQDMIQDQFLSLLMADLN